jgi:vitamin B12 transporter
VKRALVVSFAALAANAASASEPTGSATVTVEGERPTGPPPGVHEIDIAERARPGDGLEDLLHTAPGVRVRRLGGLGAFAGVGLRGTGFRHTLIQLDGVPLNPDGVEGVDLSSWPLAGLATIRITPGRAPATVGGAPTGGVVDLTTSDTPGVATEIGLGSFRSGRASAAGAGRAGPVDLLVAADGLSTKGDFRYLDDGGTLYDPTDDALARRANNARHQGAGLVRARVRGDAGEATALLSVAARDEGLPGPIGSPQDATSLTSSRALLSLHGTSTRGAARVSALAWGAGRFEALRDPERELARTTEAQRDRTSTLGARATVEATLTPTAALRASIDARDERFARRVGDSSSASRLARRIGLGAALDAPWHPAPAWRVIPGVDLRALRATKPGADLAIAALPGLSVAVTPGPGAAVWASGGATFRPADLAELYGDRGALVGNPDLRPERAWRAEAGARAARGATTRLEAEGTFWVTDARDAIGWLQNTQRTVVAVNFGRTNTIGADLGGAASHRDRYGARASLSLQRARQTTDDPTRRGRPVPFVAPARAWGRAWVAPHAAIRVGLDVDAAAAIPVDPHGVARQPPRALLGGHTAVRPGGPWTLSVDVRNALGARSGLVPRDPLGPDPARVAAPLTDFVGYPLPGRTVWLAVGYARTAPR